MNQQLEKVAVQVPISALNVEMNDALFDALFENVKQRLNTFSALSTVDSNSTVERTLTSWVADGTITEQDYHHLNKVAHLLDQSQSSLEDVSAEVGKVLAEMAETSSSQAALVILNVVSRATKLNEGISSDVSLRGLKRSAMESILHGFLVGQAAGGIIGGIVGAIAGLVDAIWGPE